MQTVDEILREQAKQIEDQEARDAKTKRRRHREREDLRWVLGDVRGQRVLGDLMLSNGLNRPLPPGTAEAVQRAIGRLDVALALRAAIAGIDRGLVIACESALEMAERELDGRKPVEVRPGAQ